MADVLKVQQFARMKLTRDGSVIVDQSLKTTAGTYTEHAAERVVLATNMVSPSEVNLGGVSTGVRMMLETDQSIKVALDDSAKLWTVSEAVLYAGSFTHLYLQNTNTTNTATVQYIVTDA
jgi:hypothetical protein